MDSSTPQAAKGRAAGQPLRLAEEQSLPSSHRRCTENFALDTVAATPECRLTTVDDLRIVKVVHIVENMCWSIQYIKRRLEGKYNRKTSPFPLWVRTLNMCNTGFREPVFGR